MGEVLKFVTLDGSLRKKTQNSFCFFVLQKWLNFKSFFYLSFGLKDLFWAEQNVLKISIKITGGHKLNNKTFFLMM